MKLTDELLERYYSGKCTQEEIQFIEDWVNGTEEEVSGLSKGDLGKMKRGVWRKIDRKYRFSSRDHDRVDKAISLYEKPLRYGMAACLAIGIYFAATFLPNPLRDVPTVELAEMSHPMLEPAIYISGITGEPQKVLANEYDINFHGLIRLYSTNEKKQIVFCNGRQLILEPDKAYFIMASAKKEGYRFVARSVTEESWANPSIIPNKYEVCLKS